MSRREDLKEWIRTTYSLIMAYTMTFVNTDRPKEKLGARNALLDLWDQAIRYLDEYRRLPDNTLTDELSNIATYIARGVPKSILDWVPTDDISLPSAASCPLQRPPRVVPFIDRECELDQLLTDLQPGKVVTLFGPGGMGKSALAAEAIWRLAPEQDPPKRFPGGIITCDFYSQPQAILALESIVRAYGQDPRPTPRDAARNILAKREALLFLDGTENADDLRSVLEVRGKCGVLIATRSSDDAVTNWQTVAPLPLDESVKLLQDSAGHRAIDWSVAKEICHLVGELPLAVCLVGRYLVRRGQQAAEYLEWLKTSPLQALDHGKHRAESVPLLLKHSLDQVSDQARTALSVVGLLALEPFSGTTVAEALERPTHEAHRMLGELVGYGLLLRPEEHYQVSHALIHTYARRECPPTSEIVGKLAAYYTSLVQAESKKRPEGYALLDKERPHILSVLSVCVERKRWDSVCNLVRAVEGYLDLKGYSRERVQALEDGVRAAQELDYHQDEGMFLGSLGDSYRDLGQIEKAIGYCKQALAIARGSGDQHGEASCWGNLGLVYSDLGQMDEAIDCYQTALTITRRSGDRHSEGIHLCNLGSIYHDLEQTQEAIDCYYQALAIAREVGERRIEANALGYLGSTYGDLGQVDKAIQCCKGALDIAHEIGDQRNEANQLIYLGHIHSDLEQTEDAIQCYSDALAIVRKIGYRRGEANCLNSLGLTCIAQQQTERAVRHCQTALHIARKIRYRRGEVNCLGNLGLAYNAQRQIGKATHYYNQALDIACEIHYRRGEANQLRNLGTVYYDLGQIEQAIDYYQRSLVITREIGYKRGEGNACWGLALCWAHKQDTAKAITWARIAKQCFVAIGSPSAQRVQDLLDQLRSRG